VTTALPPHQTQLHQVMATLSYGDAISNEALGIQRVLRTAGYDSRIYVQTADSRVEHLTEDYRDLLAESHPDNILIHHFSIGSRASRVAFALPDRMVLVYHNVTPPAYFIDINETLVNLCYQGRRELSAYRTRCDLALGDSEFNRRELDEAGFPRTGVLPVVPSFSQLDVEPNAMLAGDFDDGRTNLLFVGRTIPNKRIEDLIRFFDAYRLRYDRQARLLLVGAQEGFQEYVASLHSLIRTLRVPDVHLLGHVSTEELTALYDVADVFLSASEHEGFCVPLVEAFYKRVPVIAFAAAAVPDTMDGGGVLYDRKDPRHVASLIHTVVTDAAWEDEILRAQDEALDRLLKQDFDRTLLDFAEQVQATPRVPHPPVEADFWQQFERAEALEELQLRRPSAYQALPLEQETGDRSQESE
jgi:glycosyltransferase involved in cell wall biosynthesis